MGVPKFFRWMSERYPAISQVIAGSRIPEFDCLYLDMNGIIHNCTHSDSDSPTFRMTEDQMFIRIFNYIEHLFGIIQPKHLFFMAIDGVAPRAKMNQQRARRFRTALDAEKAKEQALQKGVSLPKEAAFDSNCITPGTHFMAMLTRQLKYFINKKISEDVDWQGVEIVLSGHEVPGEGEHKIMEYIRLAKAQPDYDANTRHCLYGLDADLIMLGLLSHDPHFCLLREEVTFGRQQQKKKDLEHQNFYLMHLCIVREYLELEFQQLREPTVLDFPFDLERIIDDFILMAFFVGNDFIPNLPNLHINEGALALMFKVYKSVLPKAGGYLNERGVINLDRLDLLLEGLADVEYRFFENESSDAKWFIGKQISKVDVMARNKKTSLRTITTPQTELLASVKRYVSKNSTDKVGRQTSLNLSTDLNAQDRKFVEELAEDLGLQWKTVEDDKGNRNLRLDFPVRLQGEEEDDLDQEAQIAFSRVLKRYDNATVADISAQEMKDNTNKVYEENFQKWKNNYYREKFHWDLDDGEEMRKLAENYVQGLQWVLFYYYRGVASWSWFYGYHYSPMISDVQKGLRANLNFVLGRPFKPFQQLMGVLPERSKSIVPISYHDLMTSPDSPIIEFYPRDFELDMNGKKMEWEAVVKIPFIDEKRLLAAMKQKDTLLSEEETKRNEFGVTIKFSFSPNVDMIYPSSLPGHFQDIGHCHCVENTFDLPTIEGLDINIGLMSGAKLGQAALAGFPSLKTLPHSGKLDLHGVSIFQHDSRNESMVVEILESDQRGKTEAAKALIGRKVFVGYPFLLEAKVVRVSDELFNYHLPETGNGPAATIPHGPQEINAWHRKAERIEGLYSKRLGIITGQVETLVHVDILKGLKKTDEGATIKYYGDIPGVSTEYASHMVVHAVESEDTRFVERSALPIQEEFPLGSRAFFLGDFNYGRPLTVSGHAENQARVWISSRIGMVSEFGRIIAMNADRIVPFKPSFAVAKMLNLSPLVLSKITSAFQVNLEDSKVNLGLNLKFEGKKLKVLGYSRREQNGWEFSEKAIHLIRQYMTLFPEFIAGIQRNPQRSIYEATDFYPKPVVHVKIKEIQAWLKNIDSKGLEKVPLEAAQLESEVVRKIEVAADNDSSKSSSMNIELHKIPRNALLKPLDAEHRLGHQNFALGDRIVYVQESGRVPIASQGTVVGINRTARTSMLDVVFDVTFLSGTSLDDRCSPFRGSTVPVHSVLNTTNRQLIVASLPHPDSSQLQGWTGPLPARGSGARESIPSQGQPDFGMHRGSFRGIRAGQEFDDHREGPPGSRPGTENFDSNTQQLPIRHRVHGNAVRGNSPQIYNVPALDRGSGRIQQVRSNGYGRMDMSSPSEGLLRNDITFRPQLYSHVAPPPSLDWGRGRTRNVIRGGNLRGDGTRARGSSRGRGTDTV